MANLSPEQLIEFVAKYGPLVVFFAVGVWAFVLYISVWYKGQTDKLKKVDILDGRTLDPKTHPFFDRLGTYLYVEIPALKISDKFKLALCTFVVSAYWNTIQNVLRSFIDTDVDLLKRDVMRQKFFSSLTTSLDAFYVAMAEQHQVPAHALKVFRRDRVRAENRIFRFMGSFFTAPALATNTLVMTHVLNILKVELDASLEEMEQLFSEMNGELDGAVFKGVVYHHGVFKPVDESAKPVDATVEISTKPANLSPGSVSA